MAEAEAPRDVGGAEEIDLEQLVEGLHDRRLARRRSRRRELRLERIAGHRRPFQHEPLRLGQQPELGVSYAVEWVIVLAFGIVSPLVGYWIYHRIERKARTDGTLGEY